MPAQLSEYQMFKQLKFFLVISQITCTLNYSLCQLAIGGNVLSYSYNILRCYWFVTSSR